MRRRLLLVAILGAAAGPAHADDVTSHGAIAMHARGDLVLGSDTDADLAVGPGAARLATNAGDVGALANGHATLHLPAQKYPQVAIVAALDDGGEIRDWIAIPLSGQANVKVETDRGASVIVRIAGRDLAPVLADRSGIAPVHIVVPPGLTEVTTIATGKSGNTTEKPLALGVLPFTRTFAVCSRDHVSVLAVAPDGTPAVAPPVIESSTATLGAPRMTAPGWFVVPIESSASAEVRAYFAGEDAVASRCTVAAAPVPAAGELEVGTLPAVPPPPAIVVVPPPPPPPRHLAIGARAGYVSNLGRLGAPTLGATAELPLPVLGAHLIAGAELGVARGAFDVMSTDPAEAISGAITTVPVLARLAYRADHGRFAAWGGIAGGLAIVTTSLQSPSVGTTADTVARPAASLFVGGARAMRWGRIVIEASYLHATLGSGAVHGRVGGLGVSAGVSFDL
jgi:hypothetical protein